MKTFAITGILLLGLSLQAMSMGHPHNLFAARKQMRSKSPVSVVKPKTKLSAYSYWEPSACLGKTEFSKRLVAAFVRMRPKPSY